MDPSLRVEGIDGHALIFARPEEDIPHPDSSGRHRIETLLITRECIASTRPPLTLALFINDATGGQIVMEGFLNICISPWARRMITWLIAIVQAAIVTILYGESGTAAVDLQPGDPQTAALMCGIALVGFTSDKLKMAPFANPTWLTLLAHLGGRDRDAQRLASHSELCRLDRLTMYKRLPAALENSHYDSVMVEHTQKPAGGSRGSETAALTAR